MVWKWNKLGRCQIGGIHGHECIQQSGCQSYDPFRENTGTGNQLDDCERFSELAEQRGGGRNKQLCIFVRSCQTGIFWNTADPKWSYGSESRDWRTGSFSSGDIRTAGHTGFHNTGCGNGNACGIHSCKQWGNSRSGINTHVNRDTDADKSIGDNIIS